MNPHMKNEAIDMTHNDLSGLRKRLYEHKINPEDCKLLLKILDCYTFLFNELQRQKINLKQLKNLIFGKKTEKETKKNKPVSNPSDDSLEPKSNEPKSNEPKSNEPKSNEPKSNEPKSNEPKSNEPSLESLKEEITQQAELLFPHTPKIPKKKTKGHGPRGSVFWKNANKIFHPHKTLKVGDSCYICINGKLYLYNKPASWVRIVGSPPLMVEVNHLERLRCNLCGTLFTAKPSEELNQNPKFTPEARATAAIFKYQANTPFNRLAEMMKNYEFSITKTQLWEMCEELAHSIKPVFESLIELAAQGDLVQNDDTSVRILSLMKENKIAQSTGKPLARVGMFTTGIVSKLKQHTIILYFSSRNHAGENLEKILKLRHSNLPPPTQVCDASEMNPTSDKSKTEIGGCHDHARRKFFAIKDSFVKSCKYALDLWAIVYMVDSVAKEKKLSPVERMLLHQKISASVLEKLKIWCETQLDQKQVDPRGHLGQAMKYYLKNYVRLTLFLRKPGVPLSNCECEQALKNPIGIRKNSYFFKTLKGAQVSNIFSSFIATCKAANVNLYHYLVALQKNESLVSKNPSFWLPWNYQFNQL